VVIRSRLNQIRKSRCLGWLRYIVPPRETGPAAGSIELAGLTVLHLDNDFEVIASVTGQPMERLTSE
jgi:hypothetical protein